MSLTWLLIGQREKHRAPLAFAQLGVTASLPATTGGRRTKYTLNLYEASGAMKNFTLGADALVNKTMVTELEAGAKAGIDYRMKGVSLRLYCQPAGNRGASLHLPALADAIEL